jgi:hypothetical protein
MNEFVAAILSYRKPLVDVAAVLNMPAAGIVAHPPIPKGGERLKIPSRPKDDRQPGFPSIESNSSPH